MAQSIVDTLVKSTGSDFISSVEDGIPTGYDPDEPYHDTGSYSFNALLTGSIYGGFHPNKIAVIAGSPATGKTWFAFSKVKAFLDKNPDAVVFYFESEDAITKDMVVNYGIDPSRMFISEVTTVQEFRNQCMNLVQEVLKQKAACEKNKKLKMPKIAIVLDSLGNLSTTKEIEDIVANKETRDMTRAQLVRGTFRALTVKLGRAGITTTITNHTYDSMDMFGGKKMGGGDGAVYAGSTIVFLGKQGVKEGGEKVGNIIHITLQKGRFTIEGKSVQTKLFFGRGLDRYWGLLPIAEKYDLVRLKPGSKTQYIFPDAATGEYKKGNSWINAAHTEQWYCDPSRCEEWFTKEFLDKVDEACAKEFRYGSAQAQLEAVQANPIEEDEA